MFIGSTWAKLERLPDASSDSFCSPYVFFFPCLRFWNRLRTQVHLIHVKKGFAAKAGF